MKYFLPDSQDLVDPGYDFEREAHAPNRVRERDDRYAHEIFGAGERVFDGILVSKAIVDGFGAAGAARYTQAQRRTILHEGVRALFRLTGPAFADVACMGDCGAFTYVEQAAPPYTVDEVIEFYVRCGFDLGLSVDHVIAEYRPDWDTGLFATTAPEAVRARQELTLDLAAELLARHRRERLRFVPIGVAQGYSPRSYACAFSRLQAMGYTYVALGGIVRLRTRAILECLQAIAEVRRPQTKIHLLGVSRLSHLTAFAALGVASVDSTSPLRQAFMDDAHNYHTPEGTYAAIRVPQVTRSPTLVARIRAGEIEEGAARAAEALCLRRLAAYARHAVAIEPVLAALGAYEELCMSGRSRIEAYRRTLADRPWERCTCAICRTLGHHVILFRGAERNRRRGFHNVGVFYRRLRAAIGRACEA